MKKMKVEDINKEQLKMIAQAIDINEVKKLILDNISEYNKFIITEEDIEDKKQSYPRKDDMNGCSNLCQV